MINAHTTALSRFKTSSIIRTALEMQAIHDIDADTLRILTLDNERSMGLSETQPVQKFRVVRMKTALCAFILLGIFSLSTAFLPVAAWVTELNEYIGRLGWLGPFIYILIYIAATVLMIPGSALTLASGAIFGPIVGTMVTVVGSNIGANIAFVLSRTILRERVLRWVEDYPGFIGVSDAVGQGGIKIILLLRLSPVLPFTVINYLLGLTSITHWKYFWGTIIGMLPGTIAFVYFGSLPKLLSSADPKANALKLLIQTVGVIATVLAVILITKVSKTSLARAMDHKTGALDNEKPQ